MYLLDTNICIYIINKRPQIVVEKIKKFKPLQIKLSAISLAELEYGVSKSVYREQNRNALVHFVSAFDILPFDDSDAEVFGLIRANLEKCGQVIGAYDSNCSTLLQRSSFYKQYKAICKSYRIEIRELGIRWSKIS